MAKTKPANIRNLAEVKAFEKTPLIERMRANNFFDLAAMGAARDPGRTVIHYLRHADPNETPVSLSYGDYLKRIRQAANLFRRLAGDGGVIGALLPTVPENYITLRRQADGGHPRAGELGLSAEAIAGVMQAPRLRRWWRWAHRRNSPSGRRRKRWPNWSLPSPM